uniref:ZP domain-containing protein n=1 Tax=Knipowitschia caucasica TaxID=637954 RepID=A0AAV2LNY1_KNICA
MKLAQAYVLGEPMYFVAKQADGTHISADERIYINQCFITSSLVPSSPKHVVIDNHGCMVEGKESAAARFLAGPSRLTQRFTMNAVLVHGISYTPSTKHLYMHCDVTVGKHPQSEHFKACNYDPGTKTWKELYGYDSVCACCKSTCSHGPHLRASRNMVTSQPWNVNAEDLKMKKLANIETDDEDMIIEWNKLEDDY